MDKNFDLFKDIYDFSHEKRDKDQNGLSIIFGIVTPTIGVVFYLFQELPSLNSFSAWALAILLLISATILAVVAWKLWLAFKGDSNAYIGSPIKLKKHHLKLLKYYNKYPEKGKNPEESADLKFMEYLKEKYIEAAEANDQKNISRSLELYWARNLLFPGLATLAVAASIFVLIKHGEDKTVRVSIVSNLTQEGGEPYNGREKSRPIQTAVETKSTTTTATTNRPAYSND